MCSINSCEHAFSAHLDSQVPMVSSTLHAGTCFYTYSDEQSQHPSFVPIALYIDYDS